MAKKTSDKLSFKENEDTLEVTLITKKCTPHIHSIQQFKPQFKANDIKKESNIEINLISMIQGAYEEYLEELIDESRQVKPYHEMEYI